MESAPGRVAPADPGVAAWADEAFALLTGLPAVLRVGLAVVEGGGRRLRFTSSDRESGAEAAWCDVDAYDDVPLNTAVRTGRPVMGAVPDLEEQFGEFARRQRSTSTVSLAAVPVVAGGQALGGFVLYFDRVQPFGGPQRRELARIGRDLGAALRRAQYREGRRPTRAAIGEPLTHSALVVVHEVPPDLAAVSEARRFLRDTLTEWRVDEETADTATLCLSELVTNAVIHSHGGCVVRVVLDEGCLTTTVLDSSRSGATVGSPDDPLQVHGRGLQVVDALATRWGRELGTKGATTWFTLEAR